ncbi:MAG: hypothetical protein M3Z32_00125 [Acidobacteriota bacterium]|nr:hypothetical protein [Acidobacteriota bacterium]
MNMAGWRFVLDTASLNSIEDCARFNVELNKIPVLFADDESVMRPYRLFAANSGDSSQLFPMMEALTKAVKISGTVERQEFERLLRVASRT